VITTALVLLVVAFLVLALFALGLVAGLMDGWSGGRSRWPSAVEPAPWMLALALCLFLFGGILGVGGLARL
jgi:hypothetical protein